MITRSNKQKQIIMVLALFLSIPAIGNAFARQETTLIWIEPYRDPVEAWDGPHMAYRVTFQDGEQVDWIWGIEGFDYFKWGTSYVLRVRISEESEQIPDRPRRRFTLRRQMSSFTQRPDSVYVIPLKTDRFSYLKAGNGNSWTLLGEGDFRLAPDIDPAWLTAAMIIYAKMEGGIQWNTENFYELKTVSGEFYLPYAQNAWINYFGDDNIEQTFSWQADDFIAAFMEKNWFF